MDSGRALHHPLRLTVRTRSLAHLLANLSHFLKKALGRPGLSWASHVDSCPFIICSFVVLAPGQQFAFLDPGRVSESCVGHLSLGSCVVA